MFHLSSDGILRNGQIPSGSNEILDKVVEEWDDRTAGKLTKRPNMVLSIAAYRRKVERTIDLGRGETVKRAGGAIPRK